MIPPSKPAANSTREAELCSLRAAKPQGLTHPAWQRRASQPQAFFPPGVKGDTVQGLPLQPQRSGLPAACQERRAWIQGAFAGQLRPLVVATERCKDMQTKGEREPFLPFPASLYLACIKHLLALGLPKENWIDSTLSSRLLTRTHPAERGPILPHSRLGVFPSVAQQLLP